MPDQADHRHVPVEPAGVPVAPPKLPFLVRPKVLLVILLALVACGGAVQLYGLANAPNPISDDELRNYSRSDAPVVPRVLTSVFDISELTIPREKLVSGGVGKDQIRSLTAPPMLLPSEETYHFLDYLHPDEEVVGVTVGTQARAYPLRILMWHEVINDTIAGVPIAVTYCPLCDSAVVFDRRVGDKVAEFGVSGLLYNSNVILYNRIPGEPESESLWSQMKAEAVSGPLARSGLKTLPVEITSWKSWWARHPNSLVTTDRIPDHPNYAINPYAKYFSSPALAYRVDHRDDRLPTKQRVLGVWTQTAAKAYPLSAFADKNAEFDDEVGGLRLSLVYDSDSRSLRVERAEEGLQWMYAFWFAWYAFHPETEVYEVAGHSQQ